MHTHKLMKSFHRAILKESKSIGNEHIACLRSVASANSDEEVEMCREENLAIFIELLKHGFIEPHYGSYVVTQDGQEVLAGEQDSERPESADFDEREDFYKSLDEASDCEDKDKVEELRDNEEGEDLSSYAKKKSSKKVKESAYDLSMNDEKNRIVEKSSLMIIRYCVDVKKDMSKEDIYENLEDIRNMIKNKIDEICKGG